MIVYKDFGWEISIPHHGKLRTKFWKEDPFVIVNRTFDLEKIPEIISLMENSAYSEDLTVSVKNFLLKFHKMSVML